MTIRNQPTATCLRSNTRVREVPNELEQPSPLRVGILEALPAHRFIQQTQGVTLATVSTSINVFNTSSQTSSRRALPHLPVPCEELSPYRRIPFFLSRMKCFMAPSYLLTDIIRRLQIEVPFQAMSRHVAVGNIEWCA